MAISDKQSDTKVVFIHIPKTGGSTLNGLLQKQYGRNAIYSTDSKAVEKSLEAFKQLDPSQRDEIQFLVGHTPFSASATLPGNYLYFTLLREPVERVISLYYHILRRTDHPLHEIISSNNWSLQACIQNTASIEFDNL